MRVSQRLCLAATAAVAASATSSGPTVDLGYSTYEGYYDSTYGLNTWKGIRYAAPPLGDLRWQAPAPPPKNNTGVTMAVNQPPECPQSGAAQTPAVYGFNSGPGNEDCLFLNLYAPPGASNLPVFVWIHGGGYGLFGALYDPSPLMNTNNNGFITVEIQYRLGAFGFLSSDEVHSKGQTNAGLLDQRFALEWVQQYISHFGGDPTRVTIGGESAGAGSVMLHALAYGGREDHLFTNIIGASAWSPPVYEYNDPVPTGYYNDFAQLAGCGPNMIGTSPGMYATAFDCLVHADTNALQNASGVVSTSGLFGTFAFLPVVDGRFIQQRPAQQLSQSLVSGQRILIGNNANDGVPLSNPNVIGRDAFVNYVKTTFPRFTSQDVSNLLNIYQYADSQPEDTAPRFDTLGDRGPTALNQSEMATGLQQTVFDIYAETSFDCPAQWLAEAFTCHEKQSWKYQYSVTPAYHGADLSAYFSAGSSLSPDFIHAFQKIWGNFIIHNTPVISISDATGGKSNATVPIGPRGNINWPNFTPEYPWQMDLNVTGGTVSPVVVTPNLTFYTRNGPGIVNDFRLANAYSWEGGRGDRCDFWLNVSPRVPQ